MRRIDWASGFAGRIGDRDVVEVADTTLGPLLRPETVTPCAGPGRAGMR